MTPKEIKRLFKDFITTTRGDHVIVFVGFITDKDNFIQYDPENEAQILKICAENNLPFQKQIRTEHKMPAIRFYIQI